MKPALHFQDRITLIALAGGLPATLIAAIAVWRGADSMTLRVVGLILLTAIWLGAAIWLRRRLVMPLQTTANLVEAVRFGDYSLRGRRARRGDALGEVLIEINELGATLGRERFAALEAAALVRAILAEIDSAVFAFDSERRVQLANRAAAELMAQSVESMTGRTATELGLAAFLGDGLDQRVTTTSCVFPGRGGRFEIHQRRFREAGVAHELFVVTDLSRALRDEERQAWQKLIRVLGHEINNSLTPIKSLAQTLREMLAPRADAAAGMGSAIDPEVDPSLRVIGERADALSRFVATYSQLARLPPPVRTRLDLRELTQRTLAVAEYRFVRLEPGVALYVEADGGQIAQVLINLLRNACDAVAKTGGAVGVRLSIERGSARVEVIDEGEGVANPANLFVPFFTTKPGGSGIGLTLSRQVAEAHGGQLQLANRRDRAGCIATLVLPLTGV